MSDLPLPIPEELAAVLGEGFWPKETKSANQQPFYPTVSKSNIQKFAHEETDI